MIDPHSSTNINEKEIQFKVLIFAGIAFFILLVLFLRIGYIQIFKNINYSERSKKTREVVTRFPPIRGRILSSDGQVVASNVESYNLVIDTKRLNPKKEERQKELLYVSKLTGLDYSDLEEMVQKAERKGEKLTIAENISFVDFIKISENSEKMPGIEMEKTLVRSYPAKNCLSHAVGHIGHIDYDEFSKLKDKGYRKQDWIGKIGVEYSYEEVLRGKEGFVSYEIDAKMNVNKNKVVRQKDPLPGDEVVLTVNLEFQKNVEDILADRVGGVVVLKPANGEILAMASYPNFDPNIYILQNEENYNKKKEIALDTKGTPLINRTLQSEYPPGSTFKMIPSTIILEENIVSLSKTYYCDRNYRLGNETYGCWNFHGFQNLYEALTDSCDIYYYNTSRIYGIEKLSEYATAYGFGRGTGIDIPFEKNGYMPSLESAREKGQNWYGGLTLITTIGQGDVKATLVQLGDYVSVIANRGFSYKPHIVKEILDSSTGKIKRKIVPEILTKASYSNQTFQFIIDSMRNVVAKGTAANAFRRVPLQFAGKTGTSEVGFGSKKQTHSLFVGFGPLNYPKEEQIVVVVLIEFENGHPLKYAANVAAMIVNSWFFKEDFKTTARKLWYPIRDSYNVPYVRNDSQ